MSEKDQDQALLSPVLKSKAIATAEARARETRVLRALFEPATVAIVGASAREGSVGHAVFQNLLKTGFSGTLYPVNPKRKSIQGVRCYPDLLAVDDDIDLAVVVIPAAGVPDLLDTCAEKGVKSAIVISAGFKEAGEAGVALEQRIREKAQAANIALLGPNCLGLINTDKAVRMNASFARCMAKPGNIAFMSQSGALCTSILDYALGNNIGFSKFISFGNKADINENDLLRYLADDPQTQVILMYLEDLSDGPGFMHIAREITEKSGKPVLAIKTGRTAEGASAAASHTGSLAGTDEVYDAVMAQSGVLRVDTVQELFDYAMAFGNQPMPASDRMAIVTNAGGPGIMATDACVRYGMGLAKFSDETIATLKEALPPAASVRNPVDVIGDARHERYEAALKAVLADEDTGGAIVILTPQTMTDIEEVAHVVVRAARGSFKPLLASFMGLVDVTPGINILRKHGVPHYPFPEGAARVMKAMLDYARWVNRPRTQERVFEVDRAQVQKIFRKAMDEGRRELPEREALEVLAAYGFPVLKSSLAGSRSEVGTMSRDIGFPLVMKIASPDILHKTDVGGVAVGIADEQEAEARFDEIMGRAKAACPDADIWGVTLQQMARPGREVILGSTRDPKFGPLLMFGLGGIYTEAMKDVTFRLAPLRELSARHMLEEIRGRKILEGVRGEPPADLNLLQECLERLSQLVVEFPVIQELDINPLIAYEDGGVAVDGRIILQSAASGA
jgi:acetate---CoA ligase (ADP-forming)